MLNTPAQMLASIRARTQRTAMRILCPFLFRGYRLINPGNPGNRNGGGRDSRRGGGVLGVLGGMRGPRVSSSLYGDTHMRSMLLRAQIIPVCR
jgi:hypothetical protein